MLAIIENRGRDTMNHLSPYVRHSRSRSPYSSVNGHLLSENSIILSKSSGYVSFFIYLCTMYRRNLYY
jgi:hypothetical protein